MKVIKKVGLAVICMLLLGSCGGGSGYSAYRGELYGAANRPGWEHVNPWGMIYIPSGQLHVGPSDQDVNNSLWQRPKSISIQGFYMDETEISNNEYRQFVFYVRDSIAHYLLGNFDPESDIEKIDWSIPLDWSSESENADILEEMYLRGDDKVWGRRELDKDKLIFKYTWYDWQDAAVKQNNENFTRSQFMRTENIPIYPDTMVWAHDFSYSYNEPMTRNYFAHVTFDNYPVVGVNWKQASAFSVWRGNFMNRYRQAQKEFVVDDFRLPTEFEWEYAARAGRQYAPYPWGGPYIRNSKGCILANFKPGRGNYPEDGGFYTVKVDAYWPNDFGLYNMAGNVAEWTNTAFYENAYSHVHDINPDVRYDVQEGDTETMRRKVVRGGSWKDIGYMIQVGTRQYEYQDTAKSYIGFRCVTTFLGRSINDETR